MVQADQTALNQDRTIPYFQVRAFLFESIFRFKMRHLHTPEKGNWITLLLPQSNSFHQVEYHQVEYHQAEYRYKKRWKMKFNVYSICVQSNFSAGSMLGCFELSLYYPIVIEYIIKMRRSTRKYTRKHTENKSWKDIWNFFYRGQLTYAY